MTSIGKAAGCVTLAIMLGNAAHAADRVTKCEQKKLKAWGKLELCLRKSRAAVLGGKADVSADCRTKFAGVLDKAGTCRFVDNGDGTVSDLDTGLQWEQKNNTCPGWHCSTDLFVWSGSVFTTFLPALNGGSSEDGTTTTDCFADHCDWRLPTIEELRTIVQCGASGLCIDPVFGLTENLYWSSTTYRPNPDYAFAVTFSVGQLSFVPKGFPLAARAVRRALASDF